MARVVLAGDGMSDPTPLQHATNLYLAGKRHEAEIAARRVVELNPRDVMAMNLLGVIAHDVGRNDVQVKLVARGAHAGGRLGRRARILLRGRNA